MKYILLVASAFLVFACNNSNKKVEDTQNDNSNIMEQSGVINNEISKVNRNQDNINYFSASGSEPFWSLEINKESIVFKTPTDSLIMPHVEPIFAMDANVKLYKIETESQQINIQIIQKECTNDMSGKMFPYAVSIEIKPIADAEFVTWNGCGKYVTDYRLHDIWVLETLYGKTITREDFSKEFPSMEINAAENKFMGFAGCNQMSGTLFIEKDILRFTQVTTTKMMCQNNNKETEFLKALQSSTSYSIENNRLTLSNPSGILTIFKKVD